MPEKLSPTDDPVLEGLVNDYLDAVSGMDKHKTMKEQLAEQILARLKPGQTFETQPGIGVRVQHPARTWSDAEAEKILTQPQLDAITITKLSSQVAAQVLPGALVDLCKVTGTKPVLRSL